MSEEPSLTRADVEAAYRFILGRPPENEAAYAYGLSAGSAPELRRWLMGGEEFAERIQHDAPHALRRWMLAEMQAAPAEPTAEAVTEGRPRVVFLHIMKTAGTSIRRRLEELAGEEPIWRREKEGLPGSAPAAELARYRVVMGHFTIADARHVPQPRRIFTVLREPRERLVSLYHHLARHRAEVLAGPDLRTARIARECSLEAFLLHPNPRVHAELKNVMTRTLAGDFVPAGPNRYRHPWQSRTEGISGPELLSRALANLFTLDFVTSVDRLERDRPRLMAALGLPDPGPFPRENTRDLVSDLLEERPPPKITEAAERALYRLTDLDRVLYRLARQHFG
jgi:hypothetical protein